jgi:hypothetical protein
MKIAGIKFVNKIPPDISPTLILAIRLDFEPDEAVI